MLSIEGRKMREKKPDKRKVQGAETKRKLFEIAKNLFSEHDFDTVNVEDITDAAGITKGAFYVHFSSKDELISLLIADYVAKADEDYKVFLEMLPDDMNISDRIIGLTEKISETLTDTIGWGNMKKIYQMLLTSTIDTEAVKGYNRELYGLFHGVLEKGLRKGEITSSLSLEALSRHFVMAIRGVSYEWCVRYPAFDLKSHATEHVRILLEGVTSNT